MTAGAYLHDHLAQHETFRQGIAAYERGQYYEAHEHWELLWRDEPEGPRRLFLQGIIQVAAALHKLLVMKSPTGAMRLFERAKIRLADVPEGMGGLSVKGILAGIDLAMAALPKLVGEGRTELDPVFVPRLTPAAN
jgi:hypothetical protein